MPWASPGKGRQDRFPKVSPPVLRRRIAEPITRDEPRGGSAASPEAKGRPATGIGGPFPIHRHSGADRGIATAAGYVDSVKAFHCDANKRNPRERCISKTARATFCASHNLPDMSVEVRRTRSLRRELS